MPVRRRRIALLVAAVLPAGVATAHLAAGNDGERSGGEVSSLAGYRIDYEVQVFLPSSVESGLRQVAVRRPFAGLDLRSTTQGAIESGTLAVDGRFVSLRANERLDGGEGAPGVPPGDVRFGAVLADLVRLGLAEETGSDGVADRPCTTYRTGAPLGDPVRPPTAEEHVEWCIDVQGLLLEERWYLDGELLRRTTAIAVDTVVPAASAFELPGGAAAERDPFASSTRRPLPLDATPDVGDAEYWATGGAVDGFRLDQRWRVVTSTNTTGTPQVQDIAFVDVYVRGVDVVTVEHREASVAGEPAPGVEQVDAGPVGAAQVAVSERGAQLQVAVAPWLLTIRGTISVAELTDFAAALRPAHDGA